MKEKYLISFSLNTVGLSIENTACDIMCINDINTIGKRIILIVVIDDSIVDDCCSSDQPGRYRSKH